MKVLYLTSESLVTDPIISSQVVPLLSSIKTESNPTLLTFEPDGFDFELKHPKPEIELCPLTKGRHLTNQLALLRWLIKNGRRFNIIHVRSYLPMTMAVLYKLLNNKIQLVFDPRGLFAEEIEYYKGKGISSFIFKRLEGLFIRKSDAVIAVSKSMKSYFGATYSGCANKINVIPTFAQGLSKIDSSQVPDIRNTNGWDEKILLCYSGSLEGWQCFDEILNIFAILENRSPLFRFVFFSKSTKEMRSRVNRRLSSESYSIYSATPEELPFYLSQCDYGFLVRRPHIINKVAAPIKVKDYLLAGLRLVVTHEVGDTSEFLSDHNCGISTTYDDISNGVIDHTQLEVRVSPIEKQRISSIAAQEFSLDVAAKNHLFLYTTLCFENKKSQDLVD